MNHVQPPQSSRHNQARVLAILEAQLSVLDHAGAYKAAAHLDAAIQQLRRECGTMALDATATSVDQDETAKTSKTAPLLEPVSEVLAPSQVVPLKATPADSR